MQRSMFDAIADRRSPSIASATGIEKVPASQLPQGQSIRRLDFAHLMRNRITNFGDAKKYLGTGSFAEMPRRWRSRLRLAAAKPTTPSFQGAIRTRPSTRGRWQAQPG
jgi:hypothetical protein